jgi:hypothetical protein
MSPASWTVTTLAYSYLRDLAALGLTRRSSRELRSIAASASLLCTSRGPESDCERFGDGPCRLGASGAWSTLVLVREPVGCICVAPAVIDIDGRQNIPGDDLSERNLMVSQPGLDSLIVS